MTIHYVRLDGTYVGGYSEEIGDVPAAAPSENDAYPESAENLICIEQECPEYADQIWNFPGWSESEGKKIRRESFWRSSEMTSIADQLLRLEDSDPTALPGSESEWREYRIKVRAWSDGAAGYPDENKRPKRPGTTK